LNKKGSLFLIPVPLGDIAPAEVLPGSVIAMAAGLDCFVVEKAKTARAFLKAAGIGKPLAEIEIHEISSETTPAEIQAMLAPLLAGRDVGVVSEAGCPGVADPGAALVRAAHGQGLRVRPLIGPSSILLALMAAGLNGQNFAFCGYLPIPAAERAKRLRELEELSRRLKQTQIFIETPFRNEAMLSALLETCHPATLLTVARELTLADEWIATRTVAEWRKAPAPDLARRPTVFLLLA
jgi:16S rRNA (cytidine1402-2'-O)-methyltransferase